MADAGTSHTDDERWRSFVAAELAVVKENLKHYNENSAKELQELRRKVDEVNLRYIDQRIEQVEKDLALEKAVRERTMDRIGKWISTVTASLFVALVMAFVGSYWALSSSKGARVHVLDQEVEQLSRQMKSLQPASPTASPTP